MNGGMILDCSLRDGAYLIDKTFGVWAMSGIIKHLINANIDVIEIGFLENSNHINGKSVFKTPSEALSYLPSDHKNSQFALMADYSRYDFSNLEKCNGVITNIRLCFFKHERFNALDLVNTIQNLGYKLFIQPVDILGYSDKELIELIELVNKNKVFAFSIVDTFGSMYLNDLRRIFSIINHNLDSSISLGFHSHNNLQMSSALSQEFLHLCLNNRNGIVDSTINGIGRGAGNTATELIALYMNTHLKGNYKLDEILDAIDIYLPPVKKQAKWGYSIPYYIAGMQSAHTNNIIYLLEKSSIVSKDLMHILEKLDSAKKKRYDYELLENLYLDYLQSSFDDKKDFELLAKRLDSKEVLILTPGQSIFKQKEKIHNFIESKNNLVTISINFLDDDFKSDFLFMSNLKRFNYWKNNESFKTQSKILLSNIGNDKKDESSFIININRVIKKGFQNLDNSMILLLRLLDNFNIQGIYFARFDGFSKDNNYFISDLERNVDSEKIDSMNEEIFSMFCDYKQNRIHNISLNFITESKFDKGE